jgi:peptidase E
MPRKQVIALGGGGFSMEPDNPLLDHYILDATGKSRPKVCFLGQATGDDMRYIANFYAAMASLDPRPSHLSLFQTPPRGDMHDFVLSQDVIYVGGGNTKSMLALWRAWELDATLRTAYARGVVLAGISAGANCWFEQCITDSATPELSSIDCLGMLAGSFCPHYDGEVMRRPTFHRLIAADEIKDGIACDDGAAAHYVDGELMRVVSSRPNAKGYRLTRGADGKAIEREIETDYLG